MRRLVSRGEEAKFCTSLRIEIRRLHQSMGAFFPADGATFVLLHVVSGFVFLEGCLKGPFH